MSQIRTFLIGRQQDCDLVLDDGSVSRHHAEVVPAADGRYFITDRASTGGTFVWEGADWRRIRQGFVGKSTSSPYSNSSSQTLPEVENTS